jgi:uncharacterized membrane protein YraQ (UPF0718 family)
MTWKSEYKKLLLLIILFAAVYYLPLDQKRFVTALGDALALTKWYARQHVILCLVPAFFIAGAIAVFISQAAVIKYFGAQAKKWVAYSVAAVSGSILAVCSCTVLPLFAGIHKRGAGLGPAIAFLYSGPAINILAIVLTARVLGMELGIARVISAVLFSVVIGLVMHVIYRREEQEKFAAQLVVPGEEHGRPLWQTALHFSVLVAILVFATWGEQGEKGGLWAWVFAHKWRLVALFALLLAISLARILKIKVVRVALAAVPVILLSVVFPERPLIPFIGGIAMLSLLLSQTEGEPQEWMASSWGFAKQILPLLAAGVLAAGFLLGTPERSGGIIPNHWISSLVGGNSLFANFFAAIVGAFMYFATLTEVPILQGLIQSGMGKGPALALLLAGPALSLPNMLVIKSIIGMQKTVVFVSLVVIMATITGLIYGVMF